MKTVLLIDDDRASRLILAQWLVKDGWEVFEADDGEAGMVIVSQEHPQVVICDLLMPRYNGFQVCRAIRARGSSQPQPKVIVMTASGYATDRLNALEAGADEFLVKPIKRDGLLDLLESLTKATTVTEFIRKTQAKRLMPRSAATAINHRPLAPADQLTRVKFWGVRGSIATPGPSTAVYGGNTSCVEVRADGEIIILDAGTGIRPLGLSLVSEFKHQPVGMTVLLTHTHWDHIQGFPFFIPAYNPKNRLRILGYEGARAGLESTLSSQMESPYFPISMQQMPGNIECEELKDLTFNVGHVKVQASFMNHPGVCVGYRLTTSAGSIAYLPDNEPFIRLKADPGKLSPKEHAEALEFARSQDQKLIEFIRDVDILIMDSQYDATEYPRHVGWGHTCVDDSVAFALSANARQLFLFHHDPGHDDKYIADLEAHAKDLVQKQSGDVKIQAAREGLEVILEPVPEKVEKRRKVKV
ncbi:MAG: response regulator [Verrucomicrobiota bacterium]